MVAPKLKGNDNPYPMFEWIYGTSYKVEIYLPAGVLWYDLMSKTYQEGEGKAI